MANGKYYNVGKGKHDIKVAALLSNNIWADSIRGRMLFYEHSNKKQV